MRMKTRRAYVKRVFCANFKNITFNISKTQILILFFLLGGQEGALQEGHSVWGDAPTPCIAQQPLLLTPMEHFYKALTMKVILLIKNYFRGPGHT